MSGVKHTPGPWETAEAYFSGDLCVRSVTDDVWIAGHFSQAAVGGEAITLANARLIAAAPDLLEALEGCIPQLELGNGEAEHIKAARAAIDRARGEQSPNHSDQKEVGNG